MIFLPQKIKLLEFATSDTSVLTQNCLYNIVLEGFLHATPAFQLPSSSVNGRCDGVWWGPKLTHTNA